MADSEKPTEIDYRQLLMRYMAMVVDHEGTNFIDIACRHHVVLHDWEEAELKRIYDEMPDYDDRREGK